jgi:hypothetical protein
MMKITIYGWRTKQRSAAVTDGQQRSAVWGGELRRRPSMGGRTVLPKLAVDGNAGGPRACGRPPAAAVLGPAPPAGPRPSGTYRRRVAATLAQQPRAGHQAH